MRAALDKARDVIIGEFQTARQRAPMTGAEPRFISHDEMARGPATGENGIAARCRKRRSKSEDASVPHSRKTRLYLLGREIVQRADFVVRAPVAPFGWRTLQQTLQRADVGTAHASALSVSDGVVGLRSPLAPVM